MYFLNLFHLYTILGDTIFLTKFQNLKLKRRRKESSLALSE